MLIEDILREKKVKYELIEQDKPIRSALDAVGYYPVEKAAPTFVLETENGLIGCITSFQNGKIDFNRLKSQFGFRKLKMSNSQRVKEQTGFEVGSVPLVGLGLPCLFDRKLLAFDFVYGGTGNELITLKIAPSDLLLVNEIIGQFE